MWEHYFYKHNIYQKLRVSFVICSTKNSKYLFLRYPSTYTPSTTGSCAFTVNKVQDDICQLRLDFQTFTGLAASTTAGSCTDSIAVAGNNLTTIKRQFYIYVLQDKLASILRLSVELTLATIVRQKFT